MANTTVIHSKEKRKELFLEVESTRKSLGFSIEEFFKLAELPISRSTYVAWAYIGNTPNQTSALALLEFLNSEKPKQLKNISIERKRNKEQRNRVNKLPEVKLNSRLDTKELKWIQRFFEEIIEFQQEYDLGKRELAKALGITENTLIKWTEQATTPSPGKIFDVRTNMSIYRQRNPKKSI